MSYTTIYAFKKNWLPFCLGEVGNSHRSAPAIWDYMEKKYLPPYMPDFAKNYIWLKPWHFSRMVSFWTDPNGMYDVWNLFDRKDIPKHERIVLWSTFDDSVVMKPDFQILIDAFNAFEGESSLKEQADIIKSALSNEDIVAIAWNQTSLSQTRWYYGGGLDENDEELPYNILTMTDHRDFIQALN